MKQGAVLINLSRGRVVDEGALVDPAVCTHLGGVALDVFETEPLPIDSPLRLLENAILTNHELSHTRENLGALLQLAIANVMAAVEGRRMPTEIAV